MPDPNLQITARGPRTEAEAAAAAIDTDPQLEACAYAILEEDERHGVWRIDAYPTTDAEAQGLVRLLTSRPALQVATEALADADWLALALSGLPP
ncbi:MAG TPA: 50S ribosomal protein L11 methyltransferase, partial [Caulobacteraceae bacterium]|nr:50S ribosomal protein L11 methyltransferase [Caulobacteraceae bacterium]